MFTQTKNPVTCVQYCLKGSKKLVHSAIIILLLSFTGFISYAENTAPYTTILSVIKNDAIADDFDKNIVSVKVIDVSGNPVTGQTVDFSLASGSANFSGSTSVTTNASGDAQIALTSTVASSITVSALVNGLPLTNATPATLNFIAGTPSTSNPLTAISIITNNQPADGISKNIVQVHAVDANGNPVINQDVSFNVNISGSGGGVSYVIKTDNNGDATLPLSSTIAGNVNVTAKVSGVTIINGSPTVLRFNAGPPEVVNVNTRLIVAAQWAIANGTATDLISAFIVDLYGNPVKGATVVFTKISGSGNFVSATTVTTDANGRADVRMSSTVAGYNFISATVNGVAIIHPANVNAAFAAGPPDVTNPLTKITVTKDNAVANGTAKDNITVHVTDATGNAVANAVVVFTQTGGSGTLDSTTAKTNANGDATTTMASIVSGGNYITATINGIAVINGSPAIATFVADVPSVINPLTTITLVANNATANGTSADKIKVHVVDVNNNPVPNAVVVFTKTSGSASFVGSATVATDANGDAFITMTSTVAAQNTVTATVNATAIINGSPVRPNFVADAPSVTNALTKITVTKNNAIANGTATDQITVHVADANGNNVTNATVVFTQTSGSGTLTGSATVKTNSNGDAVINMTSTVAAANNITATVNGIAIINSSPAIAIFVADVPSISTPTTKISVTKNNASADGIDVDKITVHITDAKGNPVPGATIAFTKASGSGTFTSAATVITDANGDAVITMTSTVAGSNSITVTVNGIAITNGSAASAVFKADVPSVSNPKTLITVAQNNAKANGTATDNIKVHVADANGNAVPGAVIIFTKTTGSATFAGGTTLTTNASGDVVIALTSTVAGSNNITATVNGIAIVNGSPAVANFVADVPSVTAATTKISITRNDAVANGTDTDKVTVHITDANGNAIAGATVDFAKSGNASFTGATTLTTNASGDATISLTSTTSGITNVTAKVNGIAITNGSPAKANFKAGNVDITNPDTKIIIVKDAAFADGVDADSIKVHAVDANGNPVAGQTVVYTKVDGDGNFVGTTTVTTDANGDALISITGNTPGSVKISATLNGTTLPNNNPVTITFRPAVDFTNPSTAITVVKDSATADNIAVNIVKVHLADKNGTPVTNVLIDFTIASGNATITGANSPLTDSNGNAIIMLNSDIVNEVTITAKVKNTAITNGSPATIHFLAIAIDIVVPKIFTPNNDGINDVLRPMASSITELKAFSIYNRWGNVVFTTKDVNAGWDGTFKGIAQPVETYIWFAEGIDKDGKVIRRKGLVTLAR